MVVAIAALAGAAIGWRFPFQGQSQSANQLRTGQQPTNARATNQRLGARQPNRTATAPASVPATTAQAPNTTTNPSATDSAPAETAQPVPALW
ncbi:hypothetical protein Mic7113_0676 [Allocoleopsis franciscana PCC 7113]|uniref:Uncharacterized protein n=2 Tax=Allocoleopsis TaxID=2886347 RepID=K9WA11_9CYAN|nr:hypothetical protein Mic7113_0676 [Allocoleopsis franciscana PCC 7113]